MNELSRRDLLASIVQALLLALFPWLRTDHGVEAAREAAHVFVFRPYGVPEENVFVDWMSLCNRFASAPGAVKIVIDYSFAPVEPGTYDLTDATLVSREAHDV